MVCFDFLQWRLVFAIESFVNFASRLIEIKDVQVHGFVGSATYFFTILEEGGRYFMISYSRPHLYLFDNSMVQHD